MVLIIGGLGQGKLTFARENLGVTAWSEGTLGQENCVHGLHRVIRDLPNPRESINAWLESHPDGVLICDEVGCGVVPMDGTDRAWREQVGRICCELAERAEAVYRVSCGLGEKIK
jgi:adenosyl cobinamide kinase/adenosyl cobinamide phosphate guanylyltransferase